MEGDTPGMAGSTSSDSHVSPPSAYQGSHVEPIALLPNMYQDNLAWSCLGHGSLDRMDHLPLRELSQWTAENAEWPMGP